nr:MAG TPA: hypothetical protein [Caudoviricetes sp.]
MSSIICFKMFILHPLFIFCCVNFFHTHNITSL